MPDARYSFRLDDDGCSRPVGSEDENAVAGFVRLSDDGRFAAWVDAHDKLLIRHLPTGRVRIAPGRYLRHDVLAFSPNARRLAVQSRDGEIRLNT